jgi:hypothetical protein
MFICYAQRRTELQESAKYAFKLRVSYKNSSVMSTEATENNVEFEYKN